MKNAMEIKSEIDKTDSRITELETQLSEQTTTFEGVQQAFIAGKSDVNRLHSEQSKLTLLSQAIESLKAAGQKLKSAFENQSAKEQRSELLERMKATANEVEPLVTAFLETRAEFHEIVSKYARRLVDKREAYMSKQVEYQSIVRELKPTGEEIAESGLSERTRTMAATGHINHPALEYDRALLLAEQTLAAKIGDAARAKRQADYNARTIERAGKQAAETAAI